MCIFHYILSLSSAQIIKNLQLLLLLLFFYIITSDQIT